jgi:hypothetical protein
MGTSSKSPNPPYSHGARSVGREMRDPRIGLFPPNWGLSSFQMKTRVLVLMFVFFAAGQGTFAASAPTVEFKGAFIKITAGSTFVDAPLERSPPLLLYIRKSSILRISMTFIPRTSAYDVTIVTWGSDYASRFDDVRTAATDPSRAFFYRFADLSSATAFCDTLLSNQEN